MLELLTGTRVRLHTDAGELCGSWRGPDLPSVGDSYDLELGCDDALRWADGSTLVGEGDASFAARVEQVDDDRVVTLRVGAGLCSWTCHRGASLRSARRSA